jgi:hypothetical protein
MKNLPLLLAAVAMRHLDEALAHNWKPGTLKDDGQRGRTEKGFRD